MITVRNDPWVLDCIAAVLEQEVPFHFEVHVADNSSDDQTPELLRTAYGRHPRVHLSKTVGNLSQSWNAAAQATKATILVRVDADAIPVPGWLMALTRPLIERRSDWSAGPAGGAKSQASLVARYFEARTEAYSRRLASEPELRDAVPSWNVAYQRSALDLAGWYDPWQASSVDWDLHKRLRRAGLKGMFVPDARVLHRHPATIRELARREAWYRTGHYQMFLKYGLREMIPALVVPGAYALVILLALLGIAWPIFWWLGLILVVALSVKHMIEGLREQDPLWPLRAVFRPLEGVAGLFGFARGLFRYGIRRRPLPSRITSPFGDEKCDDRRRTS